MAIGRCLSIITSSSGGGKSWTARKFLQESHGKVQQIILDWEGEYSNLREKFDYLLIGKGGEIPANIRKTGRFLNLLEIIETTIPPKTAAAKTLIDKNLHGN